MKLVLAAAAVAFLFSVVTASPVEDKPAPKVGDKAPDFKLKGSDGKDYTLAQFKGKQAVIIAWFPKAFTGG
jgi:peroxiredoxin Q/BCP